jgi:hypothetical protein
VACELGLVGHGPRTAGVERQRAAPVSHTVTARACRCRYRVEILPITTANGAHLPPPTWLLRPAPAPPLATASASVLVLVHFLGILPRTGPDATKWKYSAADDDGDGVEMQPKHTAAPRPGSGSMPRPRRTPERRGSDGGRLLFLRPQVWSTA